MQLSLIYNHNTKIAFFEQKYNSKSERRTANDYVSSENRYTPLRSPNGNVSAHGHNTHSSQSGHGHHHYSHVADDRGYPSSRNAYLQKGSEKERDRDYKSSRNKYTGKITHTLLIN